MAYALKAGTNWCHNFPKLARESGFYFNPHRTRVRIDWNRINTIDIDQVIRDREFAVVDENVNNVVDYNLEQEYDVKILDTNFVKLFRLAQLSVEYLLYCRQYLDRSVIIFKDELRSKLEENDKLKKLITTAEQNIKELKEKLREKHKSIEKKFAWNDSHGEIHKCPYCPKTFISAIFSNSHITRRHSNIYQQSASSPAHEQYKVEAEKLHSEIKNLKERLNQTERVIKNDSGKLTDSVESNETYNDHENFRAKTFEEEHKKYREEINNLTTMLFSEFRSLRQDEKKHNDQNDTFNGWTELLKKQENEIQRLRDELRELSSKKSTLDIDSIQIKLNAEKEYWQTKIQRLESEHRSDIEQLYIQLKITQESANRMREDMRIENTLKPIKRDEMEYPVNSRASSAFTELSTRDSVVEHLDEVEDMDEVETGAVDQDLNCQKINKEKDDPGGKLNTEVVVSKDIDKVSKRKSSGFNVSKNTSSCGVKSNRDDKILDSKQDSEFDLRMQEVEKKPLKSLTDNTRNLGTMTKRSSAEPGLINKEQGIITTENKMDCSSSESDQSDSASDSDASGIKNESDSENQSQKATGSVSPQETTDSEDTESKKSPIEIKHEFRNNVERAVEQKLKDLGVDPEWKGIPTATYKQLIDTVKYHRSITSKKYDKFEEIRRHVIQRLTDNISTSRILEKSTNESPKTSFNKLMSNVKLKACRVFNIPTSPNDHKPRMKAIIGSHEKSVANKLNIELLPKKSNQFKFQEIKMTRKKFQTSRGNREVRPNLSSSMQNMTEPSTLNSTRPTESVNVKQLSHSYESIKDYNSVFKRDDYSGLITSTPQKEPTNILLTSRVCDAEIFSPERKVDEWSLPKSNKSVLKLTNGSTASLSKKKVLFDLDTTEELHDFSEKVKIHVDVKPSRDDDDDDASESDFDISSISEENFIEVTKITPASTDNIVLKTSQSEKIAQISKQIESQLRLPRSKPIGGTEAMFSREISIQENKVQGDINVLSEFDTNSRSRTAVNKRVNKLPQPAPRTPRISSCPLALDHKSESKDSNLDLDIEDLLRMDS